VLGYEENEGGGCFKSGSGPKNPFLVMDLIRGKTLESYIKNSTEYQPFNVTTATLSIARDVLEALVYLHERTLTHRDVKPANIFLSTVTAGQTPSSVVLGDFGIVKWGDFKASMTTGTLTVTGQQGLGTTKYMSPEQAIQPREVTVRSDMYALGITLFELFTAKILPSHHHVNQNRREAGGVGTRNGPRLVR
jgi:serine/threonine-protein kinase